MRRFGRDKVASDADVVSAMYGRDTRVTLQKEMAPDDAMQVILARRKARKDMAKPHGHPIPPSVVPPKPSPIREPSPSPKPKESTPPPQLPQQPSPQMRQPSPQIQRPPSPLLDPEVEAERLAQGIVAGISLRELEVQEKRGVERGQGAAVGLEAAYSAETHNVDVVVEDTGSHKALAALSRVFGDKRAHAKVASAEMATADAFDVNDLDEELEL